MHTAAPFARSVEIPLLKESAQECCRFIRDANDFVRCLAIEFEIEFGFGAIVVPVAKTFQLAAPEASVGERSASNSDADPRRLPGDPAFLRDRFGRSDDAACDQTLAALVLAREDEDRIAFGNVFATIHRLLRVERESLRQWIANLGLDRERHFCPPLTNSRYSSQNAETFFRPEL